MKLAAIRQNIRDRMIDSTKNSRKRAIASRSRRLLRAAQGRMRRLQTVESPLRGLAPRAVGPHPDHLLPRLRGAVEILLAECADDADVQQRLRVLGIELERLLELGQGFGGLVGVVVADTGIGAHVDVLRIALERFRVPRDRVFVSLGVEIEIAELRTGLCVRRLALGRSEENTSE